MSPLHEPAGGTPLIQLPTTITMRYRNILSITICSLLGRQARAFLIGTKPYKANTLSGSSDSEIVVPNVGEPVAVGSRFRSISSLEKNARLPVWPVANGVLLWLVGLLSPKWSARLENVITGRVCPMPLNSSCSPFVLLVHHVHSFAPWDPIRWIQRKLILPEGFPSHPHRGFVTLTYILDGAFVHRDSLGHRQVYGSNKAHHSQWLYTGAGVLHEEMFLNEQTNFLSPSRQELFQLWINCPRTKKYNAPFSVLLGDKIGTDDHSKEVNTPRIFQDKTSTLVLAGCYQGKCSAAPIDSPLMVLHVTMEPGARWECDTALPTALLYLRQGTVRSAETRIETHHVAQFENNRDKIVLETSDEPADFLFLAGEPLNEPVAQQGSFVLNNFDEINQAYNDYQTGRFGRPWDHELTDDEWRKHVIQYPCQYRPKLLEDVS